MVYVPASRVAAVSLSALAAWLALAGVDFAAKSENGWVDAGAAMLRNVGTSPADAPPSVNRAAKAARGALPPMEAALSFQLISLRLIGQDNTSIVMRLPASTVAKAATVGKNGAGVNRPAANGGRKLMIACEPTVSPLATAANALEPGRCVT